VALETTRPPDHHGRDDADVVIGVAELVTDPPSAEVQVNLHDMGAIEW
jgi:hypothetical protein